MGEMVTAVPWWRSPLRWLASRFAEREQQLGTAPVPGGQSRVAPHRHSRNRLPGNGVRAVPLLSRRTGQRGHTGKSGPIYSRWGHHASDGLRQIRLYDCNARKRNPTGTGSALFAGIMRAPMTSVLMIFETTHDYAVKRLPCKTASTCPERKGPAYATGDRNPLRGIDRTAGR